MKAEKQQKQTSVLGYDPDEIGQEASSQGNQGTQSNLSTDDNSDIDIE